MKISVIIPCKNEAAIVSRLLKSLSLQTLPANEVIVVDSHSTDGTAKVAMSFKNTLPLHVIAAQEKGVANARNSGGSDASGDMLVFVDADTVLPPGFIADAAAMIQSGVQVGGFTMRMESNKFTIRAGARFMNGYLRLMAKTPWPIAFTCLFSTKEAFVKLGGFDPSLFIMEDYDYILRAKRAGYKVGVCTTPFSASDRRFKDDPFGSAWKGAYGELYRYTHGLRITKPLFRYDMGGNVKTKS
ncbi:MAG: glycosyltransferase [Candidatus Saccharimonas sp.]